MSKQTGSKTPIVKPHLDALLVADARQLPKLFGQTKPFIDTIITSPPYGNLIDYRVKGQMGHGQAWDTYLSDLMGVFKACHSLLKDTGSLWVIVDAWRDGKNYRLLPLEIADQAAILGWKLRDIIIWDKQHTLPYYRHGQLRSVYEYVLLFTKTDQYKFYLDRIRETDDLSIWWIDFPERFNPQGKSPTNIWRFPIRPQGAWRGKRDNWRHACPFPTELVARIIELTTDEGDVVFDPFAGSGVVPATAAAMGRHYTGIELNKKFVRQFETTVKADVVEEWKTLLTKRRLRKNSNGSFGSTILRLRALKYARKVTSATCQEIRKVNKRKSDTLNLQLCICLADIPKTFNKGDVLKVRLCYLFSGPKGKFSKVIRKISTVLLNPPLSNYRIAATINGYSRKAILLNALVECPKLYLYLRAKTRSFERVGSVEKWLGKKTELPQGNVVPILSNLKVDVSWMADSYSRISNQISPKSGLELNPPPPNSTQRINALKSGKKSRRDIKHK